MSLLAQSLNTEYLKFSNTIKQQKKKFGLSFNEYQFFNSHLYNMMPMLTNSGLFLKGIANLNELDEMSNLSNIETVDGYLKWNYKCEKNVAQLTNNAKTLVGAMNFNSKYSNNDYLNIIKILKSESTSFSNLRFLKPTVRVSELESLNRIATGLCKTDIIYNGSTLAYHLMRAFYLYSLSGYAGNYFSKEDKKEFKNRSLGWATLLNPNNLSDEEKQYQQRVIESFTDDVRKLSFY